MRIEQNISEEKTLICSKCWLNSQITKFPIQIIIKVAQISNSNKHVYVRVDLRLWEKGRERERLEITSIVVRSGGGEGPLGRSWGPRATAQGGSKSTRSEHRHRHFLSIFYQTESVEMQLRSPFLFLFQNYEEEEELGQLVTIVTTWASAIRTWSP